MRAYFVMFVVVSGANGMRVDEDNDDIEEEERVSFFSSFPITQFPPCLLILLFS